MKSVSIYRQQLASLKKQREELDIDIAQVLAEAVSEGHNIHDLFTPAVNTNQKAFDL